MALCSWTIDASIAFPFFIEASIFVEDEDSPFEVKVGLKFFELREIGALPYKRVNKHH